MRHERWRARQTVAVGEALRILYVEDDPALSALLAGFTWLLSRSRMRARAALDDPLPSYACQAFLEELPAFATFGKGWTSRVKRVREHAGKIALA